MGMILTDGLPCLFAVLLNLMYLQEEVIVVDLVGGTLTVPESVTLYSFPLDILRPLREALKRVCTVDTISLDSTADWWY